MTIQKSIIRFIFVAFFFTGNSYAADRETNVELQRKLYSELQSILAVDIASLERTGTFLLLEPAGGILIDPTFDMSNNLDRSVVINALADVVLEESWIASRRPGSKISSIYKAILSDIKTPVFSLTDSESMKFTEIDNELWNVSGDLRVPTPLLRNYRAAEDELLTAVSLVETFQNESPGATLPLVLRKKLKRATEIYANDALGDYVVDRLREHRQLQRKRSIGWITDLTSIFDANYNLAGNFAEARFYPRYSTWFDESLKWTEMKMTQSDLETRTHNSQSSVSGGLSASWGLFSIGGRYSKDTSRQWAQSEVSGLSITMEVLPVSIQYPWMEFGLYQSGSWDWAENNLYYGKLLSDGMYDPDDTAISSDLQPFVPTTMIVARNMTLTADWGFNMSEFITEIEQGGGSVGWGPFSLGGRFYNRDDKSHIIAKTTGNSVTITNPQVIGYFAHQLPKSPSIDPTLPWPSTPEKVRESAMSFAESSPSALTVRAQELLKSFGE